MRLACMQPLHIAISGLLWVVLIVATSCARAEFVITTNEGYEMRSKWCHVWAFLVNALQDALGAERKPQNLPSLIDWNTYRKQLNSVTVPHTYSLPNAVASINSSVGVPDWDIITTRHANLRKNYGYKARCNMGNASARSDASDGASDAADKRRGDHGGPVGGARRYSMTHRRIADLRQPAGSLNEHQSPQSINVVKIHLYR